MTKQKVLITGGTQGLGLDIARKFLENNYEVIICSRKKQNLNKSVGKLKKINPFVHGLMCDLTESNQLKKLSKTLIKKFRFIDILIHNAAILIPKSFDIRILVNNRGIFEFE